MEPAPHPAASRLAALRPGPRLAAALRWGLPLALVAIAYRASFGHGFLSDSQFLVRDNPSLRDWGQAFPNLSHDYFWTPLGLSIPYWRPLTKLFWLVEMQLFGPAPAAFHAVLLAWFGLGVAGVQALGRRCGLSAGWACAAAVLYGLHAAAREPVCMIMASSDVICVSAVVWALWLGDRWLRTGGRWRGIGHLAFSALALGSKELGVVIPPLLSGWWLLDRWRARAPLPSRGLRLVPVWGLLALYLALRASVLGTSAGEPLSLDPLRLLSGLGTYLWGLVPFALDTGVHSLSFAEAASRGVLLRSAVALAGLAGLTLALLRRRAVEPLVLVAWAIASLAPVLLVSDLHVPGVAGKYALSDRWLIQAAAATAILTALALQQLARRHRLGALAGSAVCAAFAGVVLASAGTRHAIYRDDLAYMRYEERRYQQTPLPFRTAQDDCRHRDRQGVFALAQRDFPAALAALEAGSQACPWDRDREFNRLSVLVALGRYEAAEPAFETLLARSGGDRRTDAPLHVLGARVMIARHAPARARDLLLRAEALGASPRDVSSLRGLLASRP